MSDLVVNVVRLGGILTEAGDALAKPAGQTSARWRVLAAAEETPMTVAAVARAWGFARQSVQRVADVLERDGLIVYRDNPRHRRAKLIVLTGQGRSALRQIQRAQRRWADELGERIGQTGLRTTNRVLARVMEALLDREARR